MLALFEDIGGIELFVVLIAALLVFGKRLPEVASQAGAQISKLRRSLDDAWQQTGMEQEIRQIKNVIPRDLDVGNMAKLASQKLDERVRRNEASKAGNESPNEASNEAPNDASTEAHPEVEPAAPPASERAGEGIIEPRDPPAGSVPRE